MHLILLTRGIQQQVDLWKMYMQTQMFNWKRQPLLRDKDGKFIKNEDGTYKRGAEEFTKVQGALRPIQLYEYIFPKECLPEVLGMMDLHKQGELRPEMKKVAWLLRKGMGAKPMPDIPEIKDKEIYQITNKFVPTNAVATYPIGIREDITKDFLFKLGDGTDAGYYQEGL